MITLIVALRYLLKTSYYQKDCKDNKEIPVYLLNEDSYFTLKVDKDK
jgi:hypothetical protein